MTLKIPDHIAIVMDGNGRWAQRRGHLRIFGHVRGSSRVREVVREANRLGVKAITLYAFSTENWSRPESERNVLWKLLRKYITKDAEELNQQNVRLRVIGELERLDSETRQVVEAAVLKLSQNTGLQLTFALSYGGRRELVSAVQRISQECLARRLMPEEIDEGTVEKFLWTSELGELAQVDLFIRTSGEKRVSNFLLWQSAYAEFVFLDICWPDFNGGHLRAAIEEYSSRERRFGGLEHK